MSGCIIKIVCNKYDKEGNYNYIIICNFVNCLVIFDGYLIDEVLRNN